MSYDLKEKDPTKFLSTPIAIVFDRTEREVLVKALEAYFFAEMLAERSLPLDYIALRKKLLK